MHFRLIQRFLNDVSLGEFVPRNNETLCPETMNVENMTKVEYC